ncbi:MAG TPA: DEAD/DEAH box helicase [Euryarchaeota archaeon]|nr:DEAD/DEAH box helicase [Euryarchaeota archaeon]
MAEGFAVRNEKLVESLNAMGIDRPTEIQKTAIPVIMSGANVLVIAPTGIGKTETAMLPILERIVEDGPKGIACLYITPLRALNRDLMRRLEEFGTRLGVSIGVRHGDTTQSERAKQSRSPPQILITTPETFQILFLGSRLRGYLKNVRWVIIDEIHELTEDERGAQLAVGLERLARTAGEFQRIGLSATVGDPGTIAEFLGGERRDVQTVSVSLEKEIDISVESPLPTPDDMEMAVKLHTDDKHIACMKLARKFIDEHASTLFFVNTRDTAEALGVRYHLWDEEFKIGVHHGSLSKEVRIQMEEEFKKELLKALICTSSMELGIDIGSADFTIQFNSPRQVTRIIQRVGRSGHRVGEKSVGRIIATDFNEMSESAVICRKALAGELEKVEIRRNPLTVLANQIAAMCMASGSVSESEIFETVKRAYPFRGLGLEELQRVISIMRDIRTIGYDGQRIKKTGRTMRYFYDNISMIPDERNFRIREVSTRGVIGTLDESFVISAAEPYSTFVTKGRTWQVIEVNENEVLVEEVKDISGTPSWIGEEIPVPFEVAQEVGALRAEIKPATLVSDDARAAFISFLEKQSEAGAVMPSSNQVVIERGDRLLVIHACFGTKVNETLAKIIGSLLSAKLGESVAVDSNAYSIILETPENVPPDEVERILMSTRPDSLEALLRIILKSSGIIRWQFLHVAKKFGAIEKGADYRSINLSRIMDSFDDTVIFEESLNKTIFEKMDLGKTSLVLKKIQSGEVSISKGNISPLGREMVKEKKELMMPKSADRSILMALKDRLMEEQVILRCLKCGSERRGKIKNLQSKITCHSCGGMMLTAVRPFSKESLKVLDSRRLSQEEKNVLRRLYKSANLINAHGRKALMALVARGVGPDTAARLLQRYYRNEEEYLRDILTAEVQYAKTKRFWD